jgi:hypothetical protein
MQHLRIAGLLVLVCVAGCPSSRSTESQSPPQPASTSVSKEAVPAPSVTSTKPTTAAPLDLASLKQRLRDTDAIGVFSKLSLKNQVDDLLDEFRAVYRGKVSTPLATLRQRYDLLIMKVLSLLQDSDQALASDISSSREAIWDILRDPRKFAQIELG